MKLFLVLYQVETTPDFTVGFYYVALSFVFLIRPIPATKKIPPSTPEKMMALIFLVPSPPFKKLTPA